MPNSLLLPPGSGGALGHVVRSKPMNALCVGDRSNGANGAICPSEALSPSAISGAAVSTGEAWPGRVVPWNTRRLTWIGYWPVLVMLNVSRLVSPGLYATAYQEPLYWSCWRLV